MRLDSRDYIRSILGILVCLGVVGCGPSNELKTAPVKGIVTIDGKPLKSGYVFVVPSKGRMAKGSIGPSGEFVLGTYDSNDGAQIGTHAVTVTPVPADEFGPQPPKNDIPIPRRYGQAKSSGLTIEVLSGQTNNVTLELSSDNS